MSRVPGVRRPRVQRAADPKYDQPEMGVAPRAQEGPAMHVISPRSLSTNPVQRTHAGAATRGMSDGACGVRRLLDLCMHHPT